MERERVMGVLLERGIKEGFLEEVALNKGLTELSRGCGVK